MPVNNMDDATCIQWVSESCVLNEEEIFSPSTSNVCYEESDDGDEPKTKRNRLSEDVQKDDDNSDEEDNDTGWNEKNTMLLLNLFNSDSFKKYKTKKRKFQAIHSEMKIYHYEFTPQQLQNRMATLKRAYKKVLDNNSKKGRIGLELKYSSEVVKKLDKMYGNIHGKCDRIILPTLIQNSDTEHNIDQRPEDTEVDEDEYQDEISTPTETKKKLHVKKNNFQQQKMDLIKSWHEESRRYKQNLLDEMKRTNDILQRSYDRHAQLLEKLIASKKE